jgi:hypothetical protein
MQSGVLIEALEDLQHVVTLKHKHGLYTSPIKD